MSQFGKLHSRIVWVGGNEHVLRPADKKDGGVLTKFCKVLASRHQNFCHSFARSIVFYMVSLQGLIRLCLY